MNYICDDCGFAFSRMGEIKECPFCEKRNIRSVTGEEIQRWQDLQEQGIKALLFREESVI
jgi:uncharacterized Zn finger protein (UPF0148 family)